MAKQDLLRYDHDLLGGGGEHFSTNFRSRNV